MKEPFGSEILDIACRLLVPFLLLFAFYVVFHGHSSPGGGFQGGAMMAAALILMNLIRGSATPWGPNVRVSLLLATAGVLFFALVGLFPVFQSSFFLDYSAFDLDGNDVVSSRYLATFLVEVAIALTVMGVFLLIYYALVTRGEEIEEMKK